MKNSGLADSPFFLKQPAAAEASTPNLSPESEPVSHDTTAPALIPGHDDPNHQIAHDTVIPRHHDTLVESVRLAVKEFGKEAATHRFTKIEKESIAAIVYAVKRQGIRTSENEIARIAVNAVVREFEERGDESLLAKVLAALNA